MRSGKSTTSPRAQLLHVGQVEPDPAWRMRVHAHGFHELIAVLHGRMRVAWPGGAIEAVVGDVLLYPAGVPHEEVSDADQPVRTLFLSFVGSGIPQGAVERLEDRRGRVRAALRWMVQDRQMRDAGLEEGRDALLRVILVEVEHLRRRSESPLVERMHRWVRERVAQPLALADLAREAGMSPYHFLRTYRAQAGETPMRDVRRLRLDVARDLVLGTGLPLKAIAQSCGLGTAQAMSRAFRSAFGQPPGALRDG